jgi:hypothetical protein
MILLSPLEPRPFLIVTASLWALLGGSILMADAWWLGRESRLRRAQQQPHPTEKDA